jgi:hypothetical protein
LAVPVNQHHAWPIINVPKDSNVTPNFADLFVTATMLAYLTSYVAIMFAKKSARVTMTAAAMISARESSVSRDVGPIPIAL